jgi:hypothetical protein
MKTLYSLLLFLSLSTFTIAQNIDTSLQFQQFISGGNSCTGNFQLENIICHARDSFGNYYLGCQIAACDSTQIGNLVVKDPTKKLNGLLVKINCNGTVDWVKLISNRPNWIAINDSGKVVYSCLSYTGDLINNITATLVDTILYPIGHPNNTNGWFASSCVQMLDSSNGNKTNFLEAFNRVFVANPPPYFGYNSHGFPPLNTNMIRLTNNQIMAYGLVFISETSLYKFDSLLYRGNYFLNRRCYNVIYDLKDMSIVKKVLLDLKHPYATEYKSDKFSLDKNGNFVLSTFLSNYNVGTPTVDYDTLIYGGQSHFYYDTLEHPNNLMNHYIMFDSNGQVVPNTTLILKSNRLEYYQYDSNSAIDCIWNIHNYDNGKLYLPIKSLNDTSILGIKRNRYYIFDSLETDFIAAYDLYQHKWLWKTEIESPLMDNDIIQSQFESRIINSKGQLVHLHMGLGGFIMNKTDTLGKMPPPGKFDNLPNYLDYDGVYALSFIDTATGKYVGATSLLDTRWQLYSSPGAQFSSGNIICNQIIEEPNGGYTLLGVMADSVYFKGGAAGSLSGDYDLIMARVGYGNNFNCNCTAVKSIFNYTINGNACSVNVIPQGQVDSIKITWGDGSYNTYNGGSIFHNYSTIKPYNVCIRTYSDCGLSDTCFVVNLITNASDIIKQQLKIYPNPVNSDLIIENIFQYNIQASMYSLDGKLIQNVTLHSGLNKLNLASISKGIYILNLSVPNANSLYYKISKE